MNSGVVIGKPGDPVPDIDVVIASKSDGKVVQQIKADAQGNFISGVLPKGTYVLTFRPRPVAASAPAGANPAPQIAAGTVPQPGGTSAPPPAGSERKSFFESRSNVRISVGSGSAAPVAHAMPLTQERVVEAPGGQPINGKIVEWATARGHRASAPWRTTMFAVVLTAGLLLAASPAVGAGEFGHVEFANSGAARAQADFRDGLALLHDFEYPAAAEAFRRAAKADPGFAMAYWGEAMTFNHAIWMQQDLQAGRAALKNLAPTPAERRAKAGTDREKAYLDAVEILYGEGTKSERDFRYEAAMARIHERYPDDVDAAAFYGLAILGAAHGGRDIARYMRAAAVLEEAWMNHREHPGLVHYLIHSYDDPAHAPLGLRAARVYARIAPDAGHAQHMTSHIFLALGMWTETVEANLAAVATVDRARAARGREPARCGHYQTFLGYAYLQLGQVDKARGALDACRVTVETLGATERASSSMDPDDSLTGSFANMRLRYLLGTGDWAGEVAGWPLPKTAGPGARLDFAFARTLGEIAQGKVSAARESLKELEAVGREIVGIETKRGDPDPTYRVRPEILLLEARGLLAERENDFTGAEKQLRQAVALEEALPIAFGPPTIDKPAHELLGEFLLRRERKAEARAEFEKALALTPGRLLAERGLAAASVGAPPVRSP